MSAAASVPDPTTQPSRRARLLDLVRKLIDYGKELATTLRQRASTDLRFDALRFGTSDLALILARITRGLHRATALEARLLQNAARLDAEPAPSRAPPRPRQRTAQPAARRPHQADDLLAHLPRPSSSPPRSAAGRSAPSSPTSAAISVSCRATRCGASCSTPSSDTTAAWPTWWRTSSTGRFRSRPPRVPDHRHRCRRPSRYCQHRPTLNLLLRPSSMMHGASFASPTISDWARGRETLLDRDDGEPHSGKIEKVRIVNPFR